MQDKPALSPEGITELVIQAGSSPRLRQHRNLHHDHQDPCQRLLNAICQSSYIRPHRHSQDPKVETLFAVTGGFVLITFDDDGEVTLIQPFASEHHGGGSECPAGVEIAPGTWHTVLAMTDHAVLLELKPGPFNPDAAKEWAAWAPEEGSEQASVWLAAIRQQCLPAYTPR